MKVLLTGAAGSLGSTALPLLRAEGYEVVATDRRMSPQSDADLEVVDLCNLTEVYRLMKGVDVVVHVGNAPNDAYGFEQVYLSNIAANGAVFHAAINRHVPRIIWASTIQVCSGMSYNNAPGTKNICYLPADGDLPGIPQNNYALGKHLSEQTLELFCNLHGIEGVAIRYPSIIRAESLRHFRHFRPSTPFNRRHGKSLDSLLWLSINDSARLLVACVKAEKLPGYRNYLPAADDLLVDEPLDEVVKDFFPNVPWRIPMSQFGKLADNARITAETGWKPQDTRQAIMQTLSADTPNA